MKCSRRTKTLLWVLVPTISVAIFLFCHSRLEGCPGFASLWHTSTENKICKEETAKKRSLVNPGFKEEKFGNQFINTLMTPSQRRKQLEDEVK